jgi:hypothetical protein
MGAIRPRRPPPAKGSLGFLLRNEAKGVGGIRCGATGTAVLRLRRLGPVSNGCSIAPADTIDRNGHPFDAERAICVLSVDCAMGHVREPRGIAGGSIRQSDAAMRRGYEPMNCEPIPATGIGPSTALKPCLEHSLPPCMFPPSSPSASAPSLFAVKQTAYFRATKSTGPSDRAKCPSAVECSPPALSSYPQSDPDFSL